MNSYFPLRDNVHAMVGVYYTQSPIVFFRALANVPSAQCALVLLNVRPWLTTSPVR
jgi:hypothetical protein